MASLLGEQLYEITGQGLPPEKDFFQLIISQNEVIWRSWRISLRLGSWGAPPKEEKVFHQDFLQHNTLQKEITAVFGQRILDYTTLLCKGQFDYLERLPEDILLQICSYLQLKEVAQLTQVSHKFREFCNSEKFWEHRVRNMPNFSSEMEVLCGAMGWKMSFFRHRHFFLYYNKDNTNMRYGCFSSQS
uniref:F-box domain-containing protein n=1 Tax=Periophthalmus magnuspinnatus TaxID=409849 RepID=A0A3B4A7D0_9GOBI